MRDEDKLSVTIEGHLHRDWERFSIDSDLFTPADAWQASLGIPIKTIPDYIRPWAKVSVRVGGSIVLTGRVDSVRRRISREGLELEISGRDMAAILLDCSAPVFTRRDATVEEVCTAMVRPLGIDRIEVQPGGSAYRKVSIEPGMTAWEALERAAQASGLWPWFTPDGVLKVAAPDYGRPVDAELVCVSDGTKNNVLSLDFEENITRRHSEVTILGQSTGSEDDEARTTLKSVAYDGAAWFYRPLIRDEGHVDSDGSARDRARKTLSDGVFESLACTVKVHGHRTDAGELWEPGMHIRLRAEKLCDASFLLARRTLSCGRDGRTTTLTLKPWGVWLPDTAQKAKKKKKKKKGDEIDWDLGD